MTAAPLYAAIDVGSHSTKLLLARREADGRWRATDQRVAVTGLGSGVGRGGALSPAGRRHTLQALREFAALARDRGAAGMVAAGTMALRQAADTDDFRAEILKATGLVLDVIGGDEEARLTYLGAYLGQAGHPGAGTVLAVDIGGASTELAWGRSRRPEGWVSLPMGTITLAAAHGLDGAVAETVVAAAAAEISSRLAEIPLAAAPRRILAIGATPGSLLSLTVGRDLADSPAAHGRELSPTAVDAQIARLRRLPADARRGLPGLHPQRAEVILAGAVLLQGVGRRWPGVPLVVSSCGLREGLLEDRFGAAGGEAGPPRTGPPRSCTP